MSSRTLLLATLLLAASSVAAQTDSFEKNFKKFTEIAKGIDLFASDADAVASYKTPLGDARTKLGSMIGEPLQRGAIVVCSTLEQKDTVSEPKILRLGYKWVVIQDSPRVNQQRMIAQLKASGNVPPEMLKRIESGAAQIGGGGAGEARFIASTIERVAAALLVTTLAPEKPFRSSRLDDAGRSPLPDWLDIGLASYAANNTSLRTMLLKQRLDEAFPLEDILGMSRPFVPPGTAGGMTGGMQIRIGGAPGSGGAPAGPAPPPAASPAHAAAAPAGGQVVRMANVPKDVADRMMFDAQAVALFAYLLEKLGADAARGLVEWNRSGKAGRDFLARPEALGADLDKAEKDWHEWIKAQKVEIPGMRIMTSPSAAPAREKKP